MIDKEVIIRKILPNTFANNTFADAIRIIATATFREEIEKHPELGCHSGPTVDELYRFCMDVAKYGEKYGSTENTEAVMATILDLFMITLDKSNEEKEQHYSMTLENLRNNYPLLILNSDTHYHMPGKAKK